jgi:hypothetical protein
MARIDYAPHPNWQTNAKRVTGDRVIPRVFRALAKKSGKVPVTEQMHARHVSKPISRVLRAEPTNKPRQNITK